MATFVANPQLAKDTNPKDWAYHLGCLPFNDYIVFTKQDLLAFLKSHGIEVGPNYTEINKLPKYATIGSFSSDPSGAWRDPVALNDAHVTSTVKSSSTPAAAASSNQVRMPDGDVFRASRRVREPVGGGSEQVGSLFAPMDEKNDQIVLGGGGTGRQGAAPPAADVDQFASLAVLDPGRSSSPATSTMQVHDASGAAFKPTRRVREAVGGGSEQVASLFAPVDAYDESSATLAGGKGRRGMAARVGDNASSAWADGNGDRNAGRRGDAHAATQEDLDRAQREQVAAQTFRPTRRVREAGGTGGTSSIVLG
ncbi:hypothetical protein K437DRAFT_259080 [Tilletiaria anomala UBC 951]|uniref:Uncharacterized protein n=1 Tax=Tilletiaria anomala (strain ATCC 24038 / CBS 436.72 / UBC 951) TaxID=1037660 RepID=A0A066VLG4_TILAU|nr:uncharacterized protein K437DRAFT_259080 [Tilletiaria anomala UBC 951]KDN39390.1 hypothetical protein K437DRAFT_259080 [Tilletiaria anomala UBC 951]